MLIRNKVTNQAQLVQAIHKFSNSQKTRNKEAFVVATLRNINAAINKEAAHDYWDIGGDSYALCRFERDGDGSLCYTAYQLYLSPKVKGMANVRKILHFLKFYAQKHQCQKFLIITNKLDQIKAYSRGIGKQFKASHIVFTQEI